MDSAGTDIAALARLTLVLAVFFALQFADGRRVIWFTNGTHKEVGLEGVGVIGGKFEPVCILLLLHIHPKR